MDKKYKYLFIAFLIIASCVAYGRIIENDFINFDDDVYVTQEVHVQSGITLAGVQWAFTTLKAEFWHPLTWLSLMFDYQLYGLNAGGYHITSLILHILSTLLLFLLFNRITKSTWPSVFVAAFFALHPIHVESVAWVAERKDTLSAFFWMLTLYLYVYYTEKPIIHRYLMVLLSFACGLMSKSMVVTLPIILLLLDYWPLGRLIQRTTSSPATSHGETVGLQREEQRRKALKGKNKQSVPLAVIPERQAGYMLWIIPLWQIREKAPFFLLAFIFSVLTVYAQNVLSAETWPFWSRIANAFVSYMTYLVNIFYPQNLAVLYPFVAQLPVFKVIAASSLLIMITVAVVFNAKRFPCLFVGWFWYVITLAPVIGIIRVGKHALADRYTYLPSIGIGIMLAWGLPYLLPEERSRKKILIPLAASMLTILTILTWRQCGYWKNSITLFNHTLLITENNYRIHNGLGIALAADGKDSEAIAHYLTAIELNPVSSDSHYNLANLLMKNGKLNEAANHYSEAIRIDSKHGEAHYNLAEVLVKQGRMNQAMEHFREAARIKPSFKTLNNLAFHLEGQLYHDEAIHYYRLALQFETQEPGIYFNLGVALGNKGEFKEAIENFRRAIELKPDYEEARHSLKLALELEQQKR